MREQTFIVIICVEVDGFLLITHPTLVIPKVHQEIVKSAHPLAVSNWINLCSSKVRTTRPETKKGTLLTYIDIK